MSLASQFDTPEQSTATIPASNGVLLLDSRYRENPNFQQPTNFIAKISTALEVKKTFYRKLIWNQPLYTHNLSNNLFRFQIWNESDLTCFPQEFVVFARPWYSYTSHDGNPPGSVFLPPQGNSYGAGMEFALNNDVRNPLFLVSAASTAVGVYKAFWKWDGAVAYDFATIYFRYSSVKGFCMYATKETDPNYHLRIRLLDCNYIANGHNIHGFGRYSLAEKKYFPATGLYNDAVYSSGIPNLLVDPFIVITSDTLAKHRRGKSYSSSLAGSFNDEIAILNLDKNLTGVFHTKEAGGKSVV